jgi:hypothetical protein
MRGKERQEGKNGRRMRDMKWNRKRRKREMDGEGWWKEQEDKRKTSKRLKRKWIIKKRTNT